jgi:hypothetical protein
VETAFEAGSGTPEVTGKSPREISLTKRGFTVSIELPTVA